MFAPEAFYYLGNLNPIAPPFFPANLHPVPFFVPTRIYLLPPPPPPPQPHPLFFPQLPPISMTPTRAVMLLHIPPDVTESSLRRDMEVFGEVRGVQMERADKGIVTVHFYNLRDSRTAVREIRENHRHIHMQQQQQQQQIRAAAAARGLVSGRLVWAHFVFPQLNAFPQGNNQGSLVIMNLEPTVSSSTLRHIFQPFGEVKELRETPYKREQRFVEFFDVRDAARALREMDGKTIAGKPVVIQFSRPGGLSKKLFLASRFNQTFLFDHHHHPLPSPYPFPHHRHHHRRLPSPTGQFREKGKGPLKMKSSNADVSVRELGAKRNVSDSCFIINEEAIGDGRTTVMIKNVPNKYNQKLFLEILDTHCNDCNQKIMSQAESSPLSSYDFVYLPTDFSNKCNVGYGFVNMTTPEAVWRLYKDFHNQQWRDFNSKKICEVTYARLQGVESLKEHFKNWRLPILEMEKYMPVVFLPPRDGMLLTEPISIVDLWIKPEDDDDSDTVKSCLSDKTRSDGCLGERTQNGGVSDDESKTVE